MGHRAWGKEEREKKKEKREAHYPSDVLDKEARKPREKDTLRPITRSVKA